MKSSFTVAFAAAGVFMIVAFSFGEFGFADTQEPVVKTAKDAVFELPKAETIPASPHQTLSAVPFVVQAPLGEWVNPVFQGACEETAALMVNGWLRGIDAISPTEAREELLKLGEFTQTRYGHFYDLSAADTARLLVDYFGIETVELKYDITVKDIKAALAEGAVTIIHVNGQKLNNIHYTPPGPLDHAIVVFGYDAATGDFIAHDPGTRFGENWRYPESVLASALQDYPTGFNELNSSPRTSMVAVLPLDTSR